VWSVDPAALGILPTDIVELNARVSEARADFDAALAARNTAKALTEAQHNSVSTMFDFGSGILKTIRAKAEKDNDPNIYVLAEIPAPQPPTPAGPPEQPTELAAAVLQPFGLRISWKGTISQNASFNVFRRLPGETSYTLLKSTREKFYEDNAVPSGVASVEYYIAAVRDEFTVNSTGITLQFGTGGAMTTLSMAA
jgi:hypothetical protein